MQAKIDNVFNLALMLTGFAPLVAYFISCAAR
jgi:hypothetical protein